MFNVFAYLWITRFAFRNECKNTELPLTIVIFLVEMPISCFSLAQSTFGKVGLMILASEVNLTLSHVAVCTGTGG